MQHSRKNVCRLLSLLCILALTCAILSVAAAAVGETRAEQDPAAVANTQDAIDSGAGNNARDAGDNAKDSTTAITAETDDAGVIEDSHAEDGVIEEGNDNADGGIDDNKTTTATDKATDSDKGGSMTAGIVIAVIIAIAIVIFLIILIPKRKKD